MADQILHNAENWFDQLEMWELKNGARVCLKPASLRGAVVDSDGMVEVMLRQGMYMVGDQYSDDEWFIPQVGKEWRAMLPLSVITHKLLERNALYLLPEPLWKPEKRPVCDISQPNWSAVLDIPGKEYGQDDLLNHFHEIAIASFDLRRYGEIPFAAYRITSNSCHGKPYRVRLEAVRIDEDYRQLISQHPEAANGDFSSQLMLHYCRQRNTKMIRAATFRETFAFSLKYDVHKDRMSWPYGEKSEYKRGLFILGSWIDDANPKFSDRREFPLIVLENRRRSLDFFVNALGTERGRKFGEYHQGKFCDYHHAGLYVLVVVPLE